MKIISELKLYLNRYLNTRVIYAIDFITSVVISVVIYGALLIVVPDSSLRDPAFTIVWILSAMVLSALFIWVFKTYRIIIRHSSIKDLGKFVAIAAFKALGELVVMGVLFGFTKYVYALCSTDFCLTILAFLLVRLLMFILYDTLKKRENINKKRKSILIYGNSDKSVGTATRLVNSKHFTVVGYIKYGDPKYNQNLAEKTVYRFNDQKDFQEIINNTYVDGIIFVKPEDAQKEQDRLMAYAYAAGLKVLLAPQIDEVKDGNINALMPVRDIRIEDLLMRKEIEISMQEIIENFQNKTVMVTGAAGSIGSELCRQLATFGIKELILFDNAETPMHNLRLELEEKFPHLDFIPVIGDVRHKERLDYAFIKWRPQVVFHAAAYKHVPLMEENPCEAVYVNVAGSRNVADKCIEYDVEKMVMISTDKAVNPTNIMGCTKRLAEIYVQSLGLALDQGKKQGRTKFVTTRFGNVLGSNGSVIPRFREQIEKGGPVTVTHKDITRFFMTIPEACRLVMEAATMSTGNQIFVFDMGESVKIDRLARRMVTLAGFVPDKDIKIAYTGLRPGEKLYEEVLSNAENTIPTNHQRIRIAKVREYEYDNALAAAEELEKLAIEVNIPEMVKLMKRTVPEFKSKNSRFEKYDTDVQ